MNYFDLLPDDIIQYIYSFVKQSYCQALLAFLTKTYKCDLLYLSKAYKTSSLLYIFVTHTGKSVERLYHIIFLFNLKNKSHISIKQSIYIINKYISCEHL